MKDKIIDIVAEHCVGWKNCEALADKLLGLHKAALAKELREEGDVIAKANASSCSLGKAFNGCPSHNIGQYGCLTCRYYK